MEDQDTQICLSSFLTSGSICALGFFQLAKCNLLGVSGANQAEVQGFEEEMGSGEGGSRYALERLSFLAMVLALKDSY